MLVILESLFVCFCSACIQGATFLSQRRGMVSEVELKPPYRIFDIDIDDDSDDFKSLPYFALADSLLLVLLPPVAIIS